MTVTLALDVGATKIAWGFVDDDSPMTARCVGRIPAQPRGATTGEQIQKAIAQAVDTSGIHPTRIGIGAPGVVIAPQGQVVHNGDTITGWSGTNIRDLAREVIGVACAVHNDVRVWAYGELAVGQAREFQHGRVLYLSLGTGVGGAVSDDGALLPSRTGSAGEFSELLSVDCRGCADRAENLMSGNALASYYQALSAGSAQPGAETPPAEPAQPGVLQAHRISWRRRDELAITLEEVVERMNQGDELASWIIRGNSYGLGRAVAGLVSGMDLDAVILGGGVSQIGEPVVEPFTRAIADHVLAPNKGVAVRVTGSASTAPLVGAAAYARDYAF
ncbi:ROK family protein [Corynebacterium macginleyi]|uniref:ROK family protein n=1 Tax=Corynebacterium macginleyi TaxID=38290 RepID=UPI00190B9F54|nr:ROK family protein [Corynebacterium macginleyi]MBK4145966.1 ROK family protein [Corynebacterium macginleyi]